MTRRRLALCALALLLLAIGADVTTNPQVDLFYDSDWHHARSLARHQVRATWGLPDEGTVLGRALCSATLDNRSGDLDPDDARSSLYGLIGRNTPGRVTLPTAGITVAEGAVSSWEPDRPVVETARRTAIEITGPAQRVNASTEVRSALKRTIVAKAANRRPEAYWPLEDGPNTTVTESVVAGIPGMSVYDFANRAAGDTYVTGQLKFGEGKAPPGSKPVIDLTGGGSLRVILPDTGNFTGTSYWAVNWTATFPLNGQDDDGGNPGTMLRIISDSGNISYIETDAGFTWRMFYSPDGVNTQGRAIDSVGTLPNPYLDGLPHYYEIRAIQSGGDVSIQLRYDGAVVGVGGDFSDDGLPAATLGRITSIEINSANPEGGSWMPSIGQVMVWYGDAFTHLEPSEFVEVFRGYPGETTEDRFLRLCDEHNVPAAVYGSTTKTMGPQFPDTLPNLLLEIARTDMGLIYDARGRDELEFRTGASLYNQTAALTLTFGEGGNVHTPIKPATDNLGVTNDVTAQSRRGTTVRAERTSGPLNVSDPIDDPEGIGRVESPPIEVNPADDAELANVAGWGLHVGTWRGARYKNVTVNVFKHPELLDAVYDMRPGDRITIDELDADQVELLALGGVDTIDTPDHRVTFNCVAAGPYRIGLLDDTPAMRIGSSTSSLAADFDAGTDTSMSVAVTGALWSTTADPFHIRVGGVVLNVTAVSGASSPQTFTVDQMPVNGVERLISASGPAALTRIDVETPSYIGA